MLKALMFGIVTGFAAYLLLDSDKKIYNDKSSIGFINNKKNVLTFKKKRK